MDGIFLLTMWCLEHPGTEFAMRMVPVIYLGKKGVSFNVGIKLYPKEGVPETERPIINSKHFMPYGEWSVVLDKAGLVKNIHVTLARQVIDAANQYIMSGKY